MKNPAEHNQHHPRMNRHIHNCVNCTSEQRPDYHYLNRNHLHEVQKQRTEWTDMAFYLMDEYLKEAVRDLKSSTKTSTGVGKK